ncbi:MAG: hypothetical protein ACU841_03280 [Gammaproteobacteria bacterium]
MTEDIQHYIEGRRSFGNEICSRMIEQIVKLGFTPQAGIKLPNYDAAQFSLVTDPFTRSRDLVGHWYDGERQRIGQIKFHGDGSFYAEYDIVRPHPGREGIFVEAIDAWGKQDTIKAEAKLLEIPQ